MKRSRKRKRRRRRHQRLTVTGLTVLTHLELADWLKVGGRTLDALAPPRLPLTDGVHRYLVQEILEWLRQRRGAAA